VATRSGSSAGRLRRRFLTRSPQVRDQLRLLERTLDSDVSILLVGETGAGKDLLAETIHLSSSRSAGPFVRINCGSIPADLFESELFGYERGAFTDAKGRKKGLIEAAHHGTLYLDDVPALPVELQAKLLRVVQEKRFSRLGGVAELSVDARIIASANEPLEQLVQQGRFREDLYYRLNVIAVHLPPLRERPEDIERLAEHFLIDESRRTEKKLAFSPEAMELLLSHDWPGNARELRNTIRRAVLLEETERITPASLPILRFRDETSLLRSASRRDWSLEQLEAAYIREVLRRTRGNASRAARILGISRKTLLEKRRRYGIGKKAGE
jgi:transcriptional regulator with PAS, ATPase and Fis domain